MNERKCKQRRLLKLMNKWINIQNISNKIMIMFINNYDYDYVQNYNYVHSGKNKSKEESQLQRAAT